MIDKLKTIFRVAPDLELPQHTIMCDCVKCDKTRARYLSGLRKAVKK